MIICPNCKEEIDDRSPFCDQCGHALRYCNRCGHVGLGRRCTNCGGLMHTVEELEKDSMESTSYSTSISVGPMAAMSLSARPSVSMRPMSGASSSVMALSLINTSLNIRMEGVNGAVIGRKQGPYSQYFQSNMYVSGVHAQLRYNAKSGWSITDKHSSNGTRLNGRVLQPDVEMSLSDGDVLTIANINLQVSVKAV